MTRPLSLPQQAHQLLITQLSQGDIAIDATCGNGFDSLFLAEQVAPTGLVYGFDIQAAAIKATETRLQQHELNHNIQLFQTGHQHMNDFIAKQHQGQIKAVMFNLGYLPRADKSIITQTETTITALKVALSLLAPAGLITILAYAGHQGGDTEALAVENWCLQSAEENHQLKIINSSQHKPTAPRLFVVQKKS
ncbi:MAG: class I SAM-dependent methyltransferase [Methylococcales bacterium]|nr:class I SAM-dependent methyltransferase [Methylococcales bacterium]